MTLTEKRIKILIAFGTRPEAIKMAPLVKAFKERRHNCEIKVCVTAQHREMLDQVLTFFDITPDFDLDVMKPGQDLYDITANVLLGMKRVYEQFHPDVVFVHGDTSTTFAVALAAFYQQIAVAHVEAGLRTGNIYSPWPEEANRKLTTQLTRYHFAPTRTSEKNLIKENIDNHKIIITGNTVIDALLLTTEKIGQDAELEHRIINQINGLIASDNFDVSCDQYILVTGHRRENHGQGFINICNALKHIAEHNSKLHIIYPVHLSPHVQAPVNRMLSSVDNIHLIAPLQYEQFVYLMSQSYFIITDSGGIQEEAPSLGKPVLVMRQTTERPEAVGAGAVKLVGVDVDMITAEAQKLISDKAAYQIMSQSQNPYGDGHASTVIVDHIIQELCHYEKKS